MANLILNVLELSIRKDECWLDRNLRLDHTRHKLTHRHPTYCITQGRKWIYLVKKYLRMHGNRMSCSRVRNSLRHILKEVNQVSLFFPFFSLQFSNNHLEEKFFFPFASEANCSYYIVPCVESLISWKILNLGDT